MSALGSERWLPLGPTRTAGGFFRQPGAARWALVVLPLYYLGIATAPGSLGRDTDAAARWLPLLGR